MAVLRIHSPVLGREERVFDWDGEPITLGRDPTCDVVLLEQAVSRRHARLEWIAGEAQVSDCGSDNGVWIDEERVESRALRDGDTFQIGNTKITLVHDPFAQSTLANAPSPSPTVKIEHRPDTNPDASAPSDTDAAEPVIEEHDESPAPAPAPAPAPEERAAQSDWSLGVQPTALGSPDGPTHAASASSVYSLGEDTRETGNRGPDQLGHGMASSPSDYSLGDAPAADPSGPLLEGSAPSVYSLGHANTMPGPDAPRLEGSAPSVYSMDGAPSAPSSQMPAAGGSAPSVYSLDGAPPPTAHAPGPGPSAPSVYSMGNDAAPPAAASLPVTPTPSTRSDYSLGAPPDLPGVGPDISVAGVPVQAPAPASEVAYHIPPPAQIRRADSSRLEVRRSGPTLGPGLLLLVAGAAAMITALVVGYDPSDLATLLGMGWPP